MLNPPTSAPYGLLFFWDNLQEGLDVTTSDFNTYIVPTYYVLVHTITNILWSNICRSHNLRQQPSSESTGLS